jgi:hypothetical protein
MDVTASTAMTEYLQRRLSEVVEQYVLSRSKSSPLSVTKAIRAIRTVISDCPVLDQQLDEMIVEAALEAGHTVKFDSGVSSFHPSSYHKRSPLGG